MGAKKIIIFIGFVYLMLSCQNIESNQEYLKLKEENSTLKEHLEKVKVEKEQAVKRDIDQGKIIDDAIQELSEISKRSNLIRINVGDNNEFSNVTQTDRLSEQIGLIKNRLDSFKSEYPAMRQRIEVLQKLVVAQDQEIKQLREDIIKKNQEIAIQTETIIDQGEKINEINKEVEQTKKEISKLNYENKKNMAEFWYEMGEKLISVLYDLPEVRGVKDKKMIQETRLIIQKKAKNCYWEAYRLGHQQAYSKYSRY